MEIKKLSISRAAVQDKDKNGKAYMTGSGKPFVKVGILTTEYGDKQWLSTLSFDPKDSVRTLKSGDTIEAVVEANGNFLNFRIPSRIDKLEYRVEKLEAANAPGPNLPDEVPGDAEPKEIQVENLPF